MGSADVLEDDGEVTIGGESKLQLFGKSSSREIIEGLGRKRKKGLLIKCKKPRPSVLGGQTT